MGLRVESSSVADYSRNTAGRMHQPGLPLNVCVCDWRDMKVGGSGDGR